MEVIPVALTDQIQPLNNIRTRTFFIVDSRLDEATLRSGLDDLIRNHWRKLGARLFARPGSNKHGLLEYRLPKTFDDDYKLFEWSSTECDHGIDESAQLKFFNNPPAAENGLTLLHPLIDVDSAVRPATWPWQREDEPTDGTPLLYVHLSLYTDATVIALGIPHTLGDQVGVANIMRAWFGLAYENTAPGEMVGYDEDALQTPSTKPYAEYPHDKIYRKGKSKVRNGWEYFFVILGFLPDLMFYRAEQQRMMFLPRPMLDKLKERLRKQVIAEHGSDPGLSTGDVVSAILTKFAFMSDKKPLTLCNSQIANLRGRHQNLITPSQQQNFIHNALLTITARFRITATTPLSEFAYQTRLAINTSLDDEEIETGLEVWREQVRRGQATHVCEPFDRSYHVTNWCVAWKGLEDIFPQQQQNQDEKQSEKEKAESLSSTTTTTTTTSLSKPRLMVLGHSMLKGVPNRWSSVIMCQTPEGVWCDFTARDKNMKLIEEYLRNDPMLENF